MQPHPYHSRPTLDTIVVVDAAMQGTPLQNNPHELWALLNYLHPSIFTVMEPFDDAFELGAESINIDRETLNSAHHLLRPLMLRRLKTEVGSSGSRLTVLWTCCN